MAHQIRPARAGKPAGVPAGALALALLALPWGCGDAGSDEPRRFGGLLHARALGPGTAASPGDVAAGGGMDVATDIAIDIDRAARDPDELQRAARMPHRRVGALLGPHVFHARVSLSAAPGTAPGGTSGSEAEGGEAAAGGAEQIEVEARIEYAGDDGFRALSESSKDYGREVIYTGGALYLRPRYSKFHRRAPESAGEPGAIRDRIFSELGAQMELLGPGIEVHDLGPVEHAGRSARRVEIGKAARPAKPRPQPHAHRRWRASVEVEEVSGEIVLDQQTGVPLSATLQGRVRALRDGRPLQMRVAVEHGIERIGQEIQVAAPAEDQWVPTPLRSRELEERNALLEDIAQPARAAPTPSNPRGAGPAPAEPTEGAP